MLKNARIQTNELMSYLCESVLAGEEYARVTFGRLLV